MLIDADPYGGGLDLLVGAERVDGWRWPRLATARGHLGDLSGQLPQVDGVDILSMARGESDVGAPDAEQMTAVLLSALRSHRLTVVDIPRGLGPAARAAVRRADRVLLVVQADIRGIAAGRELVRELEHACRELVLVVRLGRSAGLDAETVATGLAPAAGGDDRRGPEPGGRRGVWGPARPIGAQPPGAHLPGDPGRPAERRDVGMTVLDLDPLRSRLALLGRPHTPADVASAMRAEGLIVTDSAVLDTVDALRRNSVGAGPLEEPAARAGRDRHRGQRPGSGLHRPRSGAGAHRRSASLTTPRYAASRSVWPPRSVVGSTTPCPSSTPGCADGSRVHAVLGTLAAPGTCISLRVPAARTFTLEDCVRTGSVTPGGAQLLRRLIHGQAVLPDQWGHRFGQDHLAVGAAGPGAGPRNASSWWRTPASWTPPHPHVVRMEGRPANAERVGAVTLTDLVRQSLRMRPDRLVVGEVRGGEIADLLAAMNTGHEGGCGTVHANSAADVPARLEALAALGGLNRDALHAQVASALDAVVHIGRDAGGRRRVPELSVFVRDQRTGLTRTECAARLRRRGAHAAGSGLRPARRAAEPMIGACLALAVARRAARGPAPVPVATSRSDLAVDPRSERRPGARRRQLAGRTRAVARSGRGGRGPRWSSEPAS